jgi:UDP-GlcNAc3NAcA epimerase
MKIVTITGARPQFIKVAAVSNVLRKMPTIKEILIHTGQHFDENMSKVFFDELEISPPEYNLGVSGGMHGAQTGRMLEGIENVLLQERPDVVLVYGDTNSTIAGALAASKLHIPVAHVEAGLRSFNKRMPEEINRVMTDHVSDILFVPTKTGIDNLTHEGISLEKLHLVGDVMYDAALHFGRKAEHTSSILDQLKFDPKTYILATIHRAENTDTPEFLHAILDGLMQVACDIPVILPLHPRTRKVIESDRRLLNMGNKLRIIDPVGYLDMIMLEKNARLIATDSGGVQKEAFFYGVPCVTLREETEWVELVDLNWNTLVPPASGSKKIASTILNRVNTVGIDCKPYGEGDAAHKIASILLEKYDL